MLEKASEAQVRVYDVLGRMVGVLHEGPLVVGAHRFSFDATGLPSGLYLVRFTSGQKIKTQRLTLLR